MRHSISVNVSKSMIMENSGSAVLMIGNFLSQTICGTRGVCEDFSDRLKESGYQIFTASDRPGRLSRLLDMVNVTWRKRNQYTVAHVDVYSGRAFLWAEAVCWTLRRAGKPYILTLRGGNLPVFAKRWPRRVRHLLRSAAAVTTPSRYLLEQMAIYREDLLLQPNPLDLEQYGFRLRSKPQPRIMWMRAFHKIYNPTLAPKVVASLVQDFPDIQSTMLGPDKGDGTLQATQNLARGLGVDDRISFPGAAPKTLVSDWLNRGDIFLNTTNVDNTPVSVLEAMACGLCVVSTNVGGIPYILEHEKDALLVPPNDPEALAAAIRRLLEDSDLAESLSMNARRKAEQFDWSGILPQWESLLMSVAIAKANE